MKNGYRLTPGFGKVDCVAEGMTYLWRLNNGEIVEVDFPKIKYNIILAHVRPLRNKTEQRPSPTIYIILLHTFMSRVKKYKMYKWTCTFGEKKVLNVKRNNIIYDRRRPQGGAHSMYFV